MGIFRESFEDSKNKDFWQPTDDTERDSVSLLSSILMMIDTATLAGLQPHQIEELNRLQVETVQLLATYRILKVTAEDLYKKYDRQKSQILQELQDDLIENQYPVSDALSDAELQAISEAIRIKLKAHEIALSSLAPGAVLKSIRRGLDFSSAWVPEAQRELSSYLRVVVNHRGKEIDVAATKDRVDEQLIDRLRANPETNIVVVNAPPGSGKTTFMNSLELLMRNEGWEVVQINFDKVIAKFFEREKKETKSWSGLTAEEFDNSFFDLEKLIVNYYPQSYKGKRIVVMIDTLGYNIDQMLYGLWLIGRKLKQDVNEGRALVVSLIPQPAVYEKAKTQRSAGTINKKNAKDAAKLLEKSKGAPVKAMIRHHAQLGRKVRRARNEPGFKKIVKHTDMSAIASVVPEQELTQMVERLAYAILTKNDQEIYENWWFVLNLFQQEGTEFSI